VGSDAADRSRGHGGFWSTLFQRNFALLWFGGLASYIGDWAMLVALPLFVYEQTGSTLAAGALLTAKFAPMLLSSVAGVFVDRWDRRSTLVRANLAMTVLTVPLLIPTTSGAGAASLWIVYLSVIATSLAGLVVAPAENSLLPTLVGRDRLMVANSLNALNDNIARIAGPALGGLIAAYVGFTGVVIVNAACYASAALLVALIRTPQSDTPNRAGQRPHRGTGAVSSVLAEWVDGLRVVRRSQLVAMVFVATALALLGDSVFSALLAPFVGQNFTDAAAVIGLIAAARGVGGLIAGLLTAPIARRVLPVHLMGVAAIGIGVLFAAFVAVPRLPLALACVALLAGVLAVIWGASINTLLQTNVADRYLGRVFGAFSTTNAATMTLGAGAAAVAGQALGTGNLLYVSAALYTLSGLVVLVTRPKSPG
jgi:predicted MFS family arabinose efflux permease